MAKFPTVKEMAENVAEKALDEYAYKGRTIRQWIEIIYNAEHGTNLAEVGTNCSEFPNNSDAISRQSVIDMLDETRRIAERNIDGAVLMTFEIVLDSLVNIANALPTIQPEIVRCKDCKYHHKRICPIERYFSLDGFCSRGER